mmetsp:Transcript_20020/g.35001  ORF Transcript_20020/g.35001 Transcript_20020/m.35001 type:complete len:272 (+) Transcript_20020:152-967(+)
MATFVESVTERDAPRSRNTLDEDEEEEAHLALHSKPQAVPELHLKDGRTLRTGTLQLGIVTIGMELSRFVESCVQINSIDVVGDLVADKSRAKLSYIGVESPTIAWLAFESIDGLEEHALWGWAKSVIEALGDVKHVCILDTVFTYNYLCNGERCEPPLVRSLATNEASQELSEKLGIKILESGNLITGLTAALISECSFNTQIDTCVSLLSLRESQLGSETLLALIEPFLSLLKPFDSQNNTFLNEFGSAQNSCAQIREAPGGERKLLFM